MYKVIFFNQGKVYEIYASSIHQSNIYGFVEVEKLVFGTRSAIVLDPSEESLKGEFEGVSRSYIPVHAIIRIDEVDKEGQSRVTPAGQSTSNITPFPLSPHTPHTDKK